MKTRKRSILWLGALVCSVFAGCATSNTQQTQKPPIPPTAPQATACIRGKVTDPEGQAMAGVLVRTTPATDNELTDVRGFFEICSQRVLVDAESGRTTRKPLSKQNYTLVLMKDGYHARPRAFLFKGKTLLFRKILMVEKTQPLPEPKGSDNPDEITPSGGIIGRPPFKE
ncbi:MAG: carboxypeptidase regulatory-like domain-containing protein [Myxococcales bacterium]|nr:carboxypeptidase regulatory-like domain-containing protein [Myxococcales bacterium]